MINYTLIVYLEIYTQTIILNLKWIIKFRMFIQN